MPETFGQNHRCRHHRTCQGASSSFINSSNPADADSPQFFLVPKTASPVHEAEITEKVKRRKLKLAGIGFVLAPKAQCQKQQRWGADVTI